MLTNTNTSKIFSNNLNLSKMNNETKKEEVHPYLKEAIRQHTQDVLDSIPDIHMTPENESCYVRAFLGGASFGLDIANKLHDKIIESPTLFTHLQNENQ